MVIAVVESQLSREDYRKLRTELDVEAVPPRGLVVHALTAIDGKLRAFDLWESAEAAKSFYQDRLAPAMDATTPEIPPAQPQLWDVLDVLHA